MFPAKTTVVSGVTPPVKISVTSSDLNCFNVEGAAGLHVGPNIVPTPPFCAPVTIPCVTVALPVKLLLVVQNIKILPPPPPPPLYVAALLPPPFELTIPFPANILASIQIEPPEPPPPLVVPLLTPSLPFAVTDPLIVKVP